MFDQPLEAIKKRRRLNRVLRKPRSDSKLDFLSDEQHDKLCTWLRSALSRDQILELIKKEFGFSVSQRPLSNFYQNHLSDFLIDERTSHRLSVKKINRDIDQHPAEFGKAALDSMWQRLALIARDPESTPRDLQVITDAIKGLVTLKINEEGLNLKLRQLSMLERREERMKQLVASSKTPEEIAENLRKILQK